MPPAANSRGKNSPVWIYFQRIRPGIVKCLICKKKFSFKGAVSNLKRHLHLKHELNGDILSHGRKPISVGERSINEVVNVASSVPQDVESTKMNVFQISEVNIKNEPLGENYDEAVGPILYDIYLQGENSSSRNNNPSKESTKPEDEKNTQSECFLNLYNTDRHTLFLLSLSEEMKKIPRELKISFKSELMLNISRLVKKYNCYEGSNKLP